ncbi:MAG: tyrosine-type recombinase/integrase [Xanthobacteraceae bacterium]|nr:tyrosine-type recombinase/integrase [Xanthobacteraceae bacterium]
MPLKLVPSRNKKTKNLYIRGSYLGIAVDASCRTNRRSLARKILKRLEGQIERGEYPPKPVAPRDGEPTFLSAAIAYMEAGKSARYVAALIKYFKETPLSEIDQSAVDEAAIALKPNVTAGTRNAYVYTPVSAILHHAGVAIALRRPKGAKGRVLTDWLTPADAFGIIAAAEGIDVEFATLLAFLLYTGPRIGGALNLQREDVRLEESAAWARPQKGQMPNDIRLSDEIRARLAALLDSHERRRVFRFHQGGYLKHLLVRAKLSYLGLTCPVRRPKGWKQPPNRLQFVTFHTFRHTWATWMRRYGGLDAIGLVATKNWRDRRSAERYAHAVAREEWDRVEDLPTMGKTRGAG